VVAASSKGAIAAKQDCGAESTQHFYCRAGPNAVPARTPCLPERRAWIKPSPLLSRYWIAIAQHRDGRGCLSNTGIAVVRNGTFLPLR
jgi:hypothetical protein